MADSTDFLDLFIEEMGSLNKGSLRLTEQGIKFHHDNTGNNLNVPADNLQSIKWQRLGNRHGIKFILEDGKKYRLGGFKESDFEKLNSFSKRHWQKEIEKVDMSLKGWNYGECTVEGQSIEFVIDGKPCFEVPLSTVANAVANKNEAVLEFHQNDDCPVALIEMRFHMPSNEDDMTDPVEEFRKAVLAYAGIETDSGQAIVTLSQILCTTPRGRYDIKVYPNNLSLHGKTYDYKIPIKTIQRLFLVPHKDGRHMYFVCSLAPPIRQGQTRYHYLVFEFIREEEMEIELGLTEEQLKQQFGDKLQRNLEGPVYEIVCKLFRVLVGMKVTTPGKFVGHSGTPAIVCAHRQTSGFLYPLEKGFLYIHKPPMYIRFDEISSVHFARSDISTRSFDFEVEMKAGTNLVFNSVEKEEYSKLYDYVQGKSLRIRNAKKVENLRNTDMFADSDEEHDPYKEHVKKEGKSREAERKTGGAEDEESDPEDEDYDLDIDLAKRRKEREQNSSEGSESEPTEEWDSSGSDVVKESDIDENDDGAKKARKEKHEKKKREKKSKAEDGEGGRKKRKKKDPNAPKRATTAYMLWLNENRATIKKEGDTVADTAKRGGEMWKAMNETDKRPWEEKAAKDKERYDEEMKEWRDSGAAAASAAASKTTKSQPSKTKSSEPTQSSSTTKSPAKFAKSREYVETESSESEDEPLEKLKDKKKKESKVEPKAKESDDSDSANEVSSDNSDSD